ncbi:hypothetical protein [Niastella populi]|uniref:Uncharacterized protein n=1 Tax=Niastella populi TaxID=550983 RepID=A0A1V9FV31_9BACT|nr:hypothetical protein [Niastella populi]OQP62158.1 hypothetical protein A4R26_17915 [Niastella populi]
MHLLMNGKSLTFLHLIVLPLLLANVGCQKEISAENGLLPGGGGGGPVDSSAVFSLVPSGANCSDAVVDGSYVAGQAVGMDEELIVTVNVTKTGEWNYSTSLANGFAFAGFGSFTQTGIHLISLMAVGTPVSAGITRFNLNIDGATCFIRVQVQQ